MQQPPRPTPILSLAHTHTHTHTEAHFMLAHHFSITKTKPWRFYLLLYLYSMPKCLRAPTFIRHKDLKTTSSLVQKQGAPLPFFVLLVIQITLVCWAKGCVAATVIWDYIWRFLCLRNNKNFHTWSKNANKFDWVKPLSVFSYLAHFLVGVMS